MGRTVDTATLLPNAYRVHLNRGVSETQLLILGDEPGNMFLIASRRYGNKNQLDIRP
jgi:hypothetical protein